MRAIILAGLALSTPALAEPCSEDTEQSETTQQTLQKVQLAISNGMGLFSDLLSGRLAIGEAWRDRPDAKQHYQSSASRSEGDCVDADDITGLDSPGSTTFK